MCEFLILHYEDEPSKVDFPGLIEVALFQHPRVFESNIEEPDNDGQTFEITFKTDTSESKLTYLIGTSIDELWDKNGIAGRDAILHMVDMSINGVVDAGQKIVERLREYAIADNRIWLVTAYEARAKSLFPNNVSVYPKPSPFSTMVDQIIELLIPG